jgi:hypothetical protein
VLLLVGYFGWFGGWSRSRFMRQSVVVVVGGESVGRWSVW